MKRFLKLIGPMFLILALFTSCKNETEKIQNEGNEISSVYVKDENIYIVYANDEQKQITFNASDQNPFFYKDMNHIMFIRNVQETNGNWKYERKKLMTVNLDDLTERTVTEKKPYKDGNDNSNEIFRIGNPKISLDEESVYFTTEKWVTGDQLVKVNIKTGAWEELFAAGQYEYITKGDFKGQFLISRSEIRDKGRDSYYMLVNEQGTVTKEFENKANAYGFLKIIDDAGN